MGGFLSRPGYNTSTEAALLTQLANLASSPAGYAIAKSGSTFVNVAVGSGSGAAIILTTTGTSGAATYNAVTGVLNIPNYAVMVYPTAGIALSTGSAWSASISGTSSQFVKGDGSLDSSTYITGNQSITLGGVLSGSGTTSITASYAAGVIHNLNALANASGVLTNDGSGNLSWASSGGTGTVTSVGLSSTNSTLTIGSTPVTTSGTITVDLNLANANTWTGQQTFNTSAPIIGTATASTIAGFDASKNLVTLATTTYPSLTELSYVKGVTSAIQTQLNAKGVGDMLLGTIQTVTAAKTFNDGKLLLENVAGTFNGSFTKQLPAP